MNYLIDTHALIWYFEDSPSLPANIAELIDNDINHRYICSVSLWEIAIKANLGKLKMQFSFEQLLDEIASSNLIVLQIEDKYLKELSELKNIHKDPFDRLLIATAAAEKLTIITIDENIQKYDVSWIW